MRRAARKDTVHAEIVEALREYKIEVYDMPQPGDVLCYGRNRCSGMLMWLPLEFKSSRKIRGKRELVSNNIERKPKLIPIVHSRAEALAKFGIVECLTA